MMRGGAQAVGAVRRWLIAIVGAVVVLAALGAVLVSREFYFGPDPAPPDSLAAYRQYARGLVGPGTDERANGWRSALEAQRVILAAGSECGLADQKVLMKVFDNANQPGKTAAQVSPVADRVCDAAERNGIDDALAALRDSGVAIAPEPMGGVTGWTDPSDVLEPARAVNLWRLKRAAERGDRSAALSLARNQIALLRTLMQQPVDGAVAKADMAMGVDGVELEQLAVDRAFDLDGICSLLTDAQELQPYSLSEILTGERLAAYAATQAIMPAGVRFKRFSRGYNDLALRVFFDQADRFAALPWAERRDGQAWGEMWAEIQPGVSQGMTLSILGLNPAGVSDRRDLLEIWVEGMRGVLAIEAYASAHGEYPRSLDDLVPEFLERPPQDPRDPDGVRYRRRGAFPVMDTRPYVLYAVGYDGIDNLGRTKPKPSLFDVYRKPGDPEFDFVFNPAPQSGSKPN